MIKPGQPTRYATRGMSTEERLFLRSEADLNTGCRLWAGVVDQDGYGQIWIKRSRFRAHRLAWVSKNGAIPAGLCVLHKCDTPACVNPEHLFVGTITDNNADRAQKGRTWNGGQKGEQNAKAKLTNENALNILARLDAGERYISIARAFGVSKGTIQNINSGTTWAAFTGRTSFKKAGTGKKGEWNGKAKLTTEDALAVIAQLKAGHSMSSVACAFGVNRPAIYKISTGRTWSHVTGINKTAKAGDDR